MQDSDYLSIVFCRLQIKSNLDVQKLIHVITKFRRQHNSRGVNTDTETGLVNCRGCRYGGVSGQNIRKKMTCPYFLATFGIPIAKMCDHLMAKRYGVKELPGLVLFRRGRHIKYEDDLEDEEESGCSVYA